MARKLPLSFVTLPLGLLLCAAAGVVLYVPAAQLESGFVGLFSIFTTAAAGVIVLAAVLGAVSLLAGFGWLLYWFREARHVLAADRRRREALAYKEDAEALRAKREANMVITVARPGEQVYVTELWPDITTRPLHLAPGPVNGHPADFSPDEEQRWAYYTIHSNTGSRNAPAGQGAVPLIEAPQEHPPLLGALRNAQRILVIGPSSNCGKTTLLQWLIDQRRQVSQVFVIDPHGEPPKWGDVAGFGAGRDYGAIEEILNSLIFEMTLRYARKARGESDFDPLTVVIDEWRAIARNVQGAGDLMGDLLTEARKAAISMVVASHSDDVTTMGMRGQGKLREGFTICRIHYDQTTDERRFTIDDPAGKGDHRQYQGPGPFQKQANIPDPRTIVLPPPMSAQDRQIVQLIMKGLTRYQICDELFEGKRGRNYETIQHVANRFGLEIVK